MNTILVIEDELFIRENLLELLDAEGYAAISAPDGRAGFALAQEHQPDLIICDLMMPEMDGHAVLDAVRNAPSLADTPFIFLTARADKRDLREGMTRGADDYLTKPFKLDDVLSAVETQLQKHRALKERANERMTELRRTLAQSLPHEFRTPLSSVLALTQVLLELDGEMDATDRQDMLQDIHGSTKRLERLVENYLLFADLELAVADTEHRRTHYDRQVHTPAPALREQIQGTAEAVGRAADVTMDLAPVNVQVPSVHLSKIVRELVDNALKFSEAGDPIHVTLCAGAPKPLEHTGPQAVLTVADTGQGISDEEIARLEAFTQFGRQQNEQQGLGLGLAIVERLARVYEGDLTLRRTAQNGTEVIVRMPSVPANVGQGAPETAQAH
ncbi:MAG: response regulator [Bacteroidetes bacterium]|jgi:signal transduction histidine kinase|nr:response regulator [Bacteroidota bacterium]